jgi:hypothetical protein
VDDIALGTDPTPDEVIDASVQGTFPASDPTAVDGAVETAYERQHSSSREPEKKQPAPAQTRSPDWLSRN